MLVHRFCFLVFVGLFVGGLVWSCRPRSVDKNIPQAFEKYKAQTPDGEQAWLNEYYGFGYRLPAEFKVVIDENKQGGYNAKSKKDEFILASFGFAPFAIEDLSKAAKNLWNEMNPEGIRPLKEGKLAMNGYENFVVQGIKEDNSLYQWLVMCREKATDKSFVIIIQLPNNTEGQALGQKILCSVTKL
ncbi:MAG TPA: hypothetical protein DCM08_05490 [Microscillaceae bacterium]|nr:hypothetical protein [Microscillaceae bacterium]